MIEKIKALCIKHREILVYLIVGGLTTVVSWAAKFIWNFAFYAGTAYPTVIQNFILSVVNWVAGVAFAYPMNRRFVFQSKNPDILKEAGGFVMSRVATLILDIVMMQVLVLLGIGNTRPMEERVVKFLRRKTEKLIVLDAAALDLSAYPAFIRPLAASLVLNRLCAMYIDEMSYVMGHPVSSRRYMGVEKY